MKKAFITGVTGQDGSYLSELLLEKGYEVHGLVRRSSFFNRGRIEDIRQKTKSSGQFQLHYGDMTDSSSLNKLIAMIQPDEVYNLAAQSHVAVSFATPDYTAQVDGMGTLLFARYFQALWIAGIAVRGVTESCRFSGRRPDATR